MPSKPLIFVYKDFSQVLRSPFECVFSIPNIKPGFGSISEVVEKAKIIPSTLHSSSWTSPPPIPLLNTQVILYPLHSHHLPVPVLRWPVLWVFSLLCSFYSFTNSISLVLTQQTNMANAQWMPMVHTQHGDMLKHNTRWLQTVWKDFLWAIQQFSILPNEWLVSQA